MVIVLQTVPMDIFKILLTTRARNAVQHVKRAPRLLLVTVVITQVVFIKGNASRTAQVRRGIKSLTQQQLNVLANNAIIHANNVHQQVHA